MLTPSFVSHTCELGPSTPKVGVDALPIRQVKCDSPEHLLQAEGGERFGDAFRRFASQEGIYNGVKGNPAPGNVISAIALFDVSCRHTAPVFSIGRAEVPSQKPLRFLLTEVSRRDPSGVARRLNFPEPGFRPAPVRNL
jgi:hypothetical protein